VQFKLEQPEFSEVRNCVSGLSRELAVPPSKLILFLNAAVYSLRAKHAKHRMCELEIQVGYSG
jgi:hypothetical protein